MSKESRARVLLVGGSGYFGRLLAGELLRDTHASIAIAARDVRNAELVRRERGDDRLSSLALDLADERAVENALEGVQLAICAAGPYQTLPTTLASACIARGVPYIDLADDRRFVARVRALATGARETLPPIATGWSAVPALSAVLVRIASEGFDAIDTIRVHMAPGNRNPRSHATVASLLASVGKPLEILREGELRSARGWSEPRPFSFPAPIGPRRGFLVDVPDHELFPELFGARTVEFRAGAELSPLNEVVRVLAWSSRSIDWTRHATLVRTGMALFAPLGTSAGALGVELEGRRGATACAARASLVANERGERIAVLPAAVIAKRMLESRVAGGVLAWDRWLDRDGLESEARRRDTRLVVDEDACR